MTQWAILSSLTKRRAESAAASEAARGRKVTLMRKYRTGELPDIQRVSVAALLSPLGASHDFIGLLLLMRTLDALIQSGPYLARLTMRLHDL